MTDWEIRNMIVTRPTEAFAYIKQLQRELESVKAEAKIINTLAEVPAINPVTPAEMKLAIDRVIAIENIPIPDYCDG